MVVILCNGEYVNTAASMSIAERCVELSMSKLARVPSKDGKSPSGGQSNGSPVWSKCWRNKRGKLLHMELVEITQVLDHVDHL